MGGGVALFVGEEGGEVVCGDEVALFDFVKCPGGGGGVCPVWLGVG